MEVVRVDGDGAPEVVPQQRLQFKGNRYFFTDTLRLGPDQAYISPFDLNVDQGVVEVPYKPTIRFGTPVFDSSGRKRGVVVLNYLGARLIASLRRIAETSDGTPHLVNPEGYWLSSPDPAQEWGFLLPDRRDQRFDQAFPEAWEAIGRDDEGVVIGSFGAFVFTTIHPAAGLKMVSSTGSSEITGSSAASVSEASYTWKLVSHIPSDRLNADSRILLTRLFVLAAAMFVLIGLASWYVAQTSLQRALGRQRLRHQALHDGLTGLPNRVLFTDRLEQALRVARRTRTSCGVLFLDLDGFKQVNDTRGHAVGDLLLRSVAERLRGALRRSDTVARMGGDEFTVILPEIRTPEDARMVADKLVAFLALPFVLNGAEVRIGVSIGIACYPADGEEAESLLVQADAAMYEAKQCGKGTARAVRPLSPE
jgi:diguanylate cyclase (GGDEF)-like protein